jgi:predicted alpha/beta-fold hydrolase
MSRSQKEKLSKLHFKDKKLNRLLHNKNVSDADMVLLNFAYEEKINLNFFYAIGASLFTSVLTNWVLFRSYRGTYQVGFVGLSSLGLHLFFTQRINKRFERLVTPYFEKYEVK